MNHPLILFGVSALAGCSENAFGYADFAAVDTGYGFSSDGGQDADVDDDGGELAPEEENDFLSLLPATTQKYVFVVNTERNTISRISVPSLEVRTARVGVRPNAVATASDYRRAVTLNLGSDDISVIDAETLDVQNVPIQPELNQLALSPDGRWVVAYHDVDAVEEGDPGPDGAISYNEISVVDLDTRAHYEAVVGTFPHEVVFTADSRTAVVVSDDYLAVLTLSSDGLSPIRVPLTDGSLNPPAAEEVLLTPDGAYAFVRQFGADALVLVDLVSALPERLVVGDNPTDIDLSPDGQEAIVVARGSNELWIYDVDDPTAPPEVISTPADDVYGSILMSPDNRKGLLYSTASGQARYGVWDRTTNAVTSRRLVKPVAGVGVSPRGNTALVFHSENNGEIDVDSPFYDSNALTLIELETFFPNPIKLISEPIAYANASDGETGFFIMEGQPYLGVLDYQTIDHDIQILPSEPVHLGVLPETDVAFVNQIHPLGRLSFYDPDTVERRSALQTLTGFELNASIEQGDQ